MEQARRGQGRRPREWDLGSLDAGGGRFWVSLRVVEREPADEDGSGKYDVVCVCYDRARGMRKTEIPLGREFETVAQAKDFARAHYIGWRQSPAHLERIIGKAIEERRLE